MYGKLCNLHAGSALLLAFMVLLGQKVKAAQGIHFVNNTAVVTWFQTYQILNGTYYILGAPLAGQISANGQINANASLNNSSSYETFWSALGPCDRFTNQGSTSIGPGPYEQRYYDMIWNGGLPPIWCYHYSVHNSSPFRRHYTVVRNDNSATVAEFDVLPGATVTGEICAEDGLKHDMTIYATEFQGDGQTSTSIGTVDSNDSGWYQQGGSTPNQPPDVDNGNPLPPDTTTNAPGQGIQYQSGDTNLAKETTLRTVGDVLHKDLVNGFKRVTDYLDAINKKLDALQVMTNQLNNLTMLTNLTKGSNYMQGDATLETWANAQLTSDNNFADGESAAIDTAAAAMGGKATAIGQTGGLTDSSSAWNVVLGATGDQTTVDFNPMHQAEIAQLATWVRNLLYWLFILGIAIFVLKISMDRFDSLIHTNKNPVNTNSYPGMGWVVAKTVARLMVIPAIIAIAGYVVANGMLNGWLDYLASNPLASTWQPVQRGVWLCNQFVPLTEALTITGSVLSYWVTLFALTSKYQVRVKASAV